ncbi:MAG: UbiX family flavin prenyltransferase [Chloroflexi bacterium]|nr:UbiX family flavin prenyltransferase [Chloroflexota bacterium]
MRVIVGITGASGSIYGLRLLETLAQGGGVELHLVVTHSGKRVIKQETGRSVEEVRKLAHFWHDINDVGACIASGSFKRDGMVVAPCSMKTLAAIACSYSDNLLSRAADVTLKERRPLILMARETPLHLGHVRNMLQATEMGAILLPPMPSFYHHPRTIDDIVNHTVGRVLDLLGVQHQLSTPWSGLDELSVVDIPPGER